MFSIFRTAFPAARWLLLYAWPLLANAQSPTPASIPHQTPAPQTHVSAFDGYKPYAEEPVQPWAPANATVARIGGWRTYAKEAAQPAPSASGNTAPTAHPHQHHQHPEAAK